MARYIHLLKPDHSIFSLGGWEREAVLASGGYTGQLELITKVPYSTLMKTVNMVILFDEGQDSYWDLDLWNEFFKSLEPGVGPIVVMFASFGSDGDAPVGRNNLTLKPK